MEQALGFLSSILAKHYDFKDLQGLKLNNRVPYLRKTFFWVLTQVYVSDYRTL